MKIQPDDMVMFIQPIEWQHPDTGEKVTLIRCGMPATVARVDGKGFCMFDKPIHVRAPMSNGVIFGVIDHVHEDCLMPIRPGDRADSSPAGQDLEVSA